MRQRRVVRAEGKDIKDELPWDLFAELLSSKQNLTLGHGDGSGCAEVVVWWKYLVILGNTCNSNKIWCLIMGGWWVHLRGISSGWNSTLA